MKHIKRLVEREAERLEILIGSSVDNPKNGWHEELAEYREFLAMERKTIPNVEEYGLPEPKTFWNEDIQRWEIE